MNLIIGMAVPILRHKCRYLKGTYQKWLLASNSRYHVHAAHPQTLQLSPDRLRYLLTESNDEQTQYATLVCLTC